jgi:hypothetical protein
MGQPIQLKSEHMLITQCKNPFERTSHQRATFSERMLITQCKNPFERTSHQRATFTQQVVRVLDLFATISSKACCLKTAGSPFISLYPVTTPTKHHLFWHDHTSFLTFL